MEPKQTFEKGIPNTERQENFVKNGNFLGSFAPELKIILEQHDLEWSDDARDVRSKLREIATSDITLEQTTALREVFATMGFMDPIDDLNDIQDESLIEEIEAYDAFGRATRNWPESPPLPDWAIPVAPDGWYDSPVDVVISEDPRNVFEVAVNDSDSESSSMPRPSLLFAYDEPEYEWYSDGDFTIWDDGEVTSFTDWWSKHITPTANSIVSFTRQPWALRQRRILEKFLKTSGHENIPICTKAEAAPVNITSNLILDELVRMLDMDVAEAKKAEERTSPATSGEPQLEEDGLETKAGAEQSVPE